MKTKIECISPIDQSIYVEKLTFSEEEMCQVVEKARMAQRYWRETPIDERIRLVRLAIDYLGHMNDEITVELAHMMGRPVRYGGEYGGVKERTDYVSTIAESTLDDILIENSDAFERRLVREPHGVVLVVAPWNYPYLTAINTIVPALMAGNVVILKPATQTLLTGERLQQAFDQAGLPSGVFQNVFLTHEVTNKFVSNRSFNFINFTGSVKGGKNLEEVAAGTFVSLGLELGGKDPGYVMEDADVDKAVETLMDAAMYNSGQCCCGIERIYVNEKHYPYFVEKAVALVEKYHLGDPLEESTTLGPMASLRFAEEVRSQVTEAIQSGARAMINPSKFIDEGTYVIPQVLTEVDHSMRVMKEESFGPVVGIMKVKDDQEAIQLMNDSPYGLTTSLWTQNIERAKAIGRELHTGTVFMNRADYLDPALCWTGCKDTGRGGSLSVIGFHNLTRPKSYHLKKF